MGSKKKEVLLSIANSQRECAHSYYVLCRYVCACAQFFLPHSYFDSFWDILCIVMSAQTPGSSFFWDTPTMYRYVCANSWFFILILFATLLLCIVMCAQTPIKEIKRTNSYYCCIHALDSFIWFLESILFATLILFDSLHSFSFTRTNSYYCCIIHALDSFIWFLESILFATCCIILFTLLE